MLAAQEFAMEADTWFIRRLEKNAAKREKLIAKYRAKLDKYEEKHRQGKVTRAKLEMKKKHFEQKIRYSSAKLHQYRGQIGKERRKESEQST